MGTWGATKTIPVAGTHGVGAEAPEATPHMRFFVFSSRFLSFFRLETPRNLK